MQRPAIYYVDDGFDTSGKRLVGRQAAGEGFLRAMARYTTSDVLYGATSNKRSIDAMQQRVAPDLRHDVRLEWLKLFLPEEMRRASVVYRSDPVLGELAWQRRFFDQRAYSLCGLTHTICSREAMQAIGDMLTLPLQPWDAVICTSQSVRTSVAEIHANYQEYLAERTGGKPSISLQLPVIPLGVDCDEQQKYRQQTQTRKALRKTLEVADDDVLVMFLGRLNFYTKAHPTPLWMAASQAAAKCKTKLHLLMVGWFEDEREEQAYRAAAKTFAPNVATSFLDGRQPELRAAAWSAADLFVSPVDNVQETFGLTPLEAMAAGIPVIVSDWNGYRETVRDGIDGFRIPTIAPPAGTGIDLAHRYNGDTNLYSQVVARLSMATTVDPAFLAQALVRLVDDKTLRQKMGAEGARYAREKFDWRVVIGLYEQLWEELGRIRGAAPETAPRRPDQPAAPLCDDLLRVFANYATTTISESTPLFLGTHYSPENLPKLASEWMSNFGRDSRLPAEELQRIMLVVEMMPGIRVDQLGLASLDAISIRSLGYLLKFGLLATHPTQLSS